MTKPFAELGSLEKEEVENAMNSLSRTLHGAARTRKHNAKHGRLHGQRLRAKAMKTGGVPVVFPRRTRKRDKPKLFVLCDLSDSVRAASSMFLHATKTLTQLLGETRSFVFVRDLREATETLAEPHGLERVMAGELVPLGELSSYDRAFSRFSREHARELDGRATVVVFGDGRTNHKGSGLGALSDIKKRCREILFIVSEPRATWGTGDSAVMTYAKLGRVIEAPHARGLAQAVRHLVRGD